MVYLLLKIALNWDQSTTSAMRGTSWYRTWSNRMRCWQVFSAESERTIMMDWESSICNTTYYVCSGSEPRSQTCFHLFNVARRKGESLAKGLVSEITWAELSVIDGWPHLASMFNARHHNTRSWRQVKNVCADIILHWSLQCPCKIFLPLCTCAYNFMCLCVCVCECAYSRGLFSVLISTCLYHVQVVLALSQHEWQTMNKNTRLSVLCIIMSSPLTIVFIMLVVHNNYTIMQVPHTSNFVVYALYNNT